VITLKEKFFGCIASTWIGSAMGAAVEGWDRKDIEEKYGWLDQMLPYKHWFKGWRFPGGTTEDGIERQKLMSTAIIEKGDRITAGDLVRVWKRDLDPEKAVYKQEPFDVALCNLAQAGCPSTMLGTMWPFPNVNAVGRAAHPIGLINAGDPERAAIDTYDIGRLYAYDNVPALCWAALYNAGVAAACAPDATLDSVLDVMRSYTTYRREAAGLYGRYDTIQKDLERCIEIAQKAGDFQSFCEEFDKVYYGGKHIVYDMAQANEIIPKGVAIFVFSKGDPKESIINAVNMGRDTDCSAAVSSGLSGALNGGASLPQEWIEQVDAATHDDPYTNNKRTMRETSDGLFAAYLARRAKQQQWLDKMSDEAFLAE